MSKEELRDEDYRDTFFVLPDLRKKRKKKKVRYLKPKYVDPKLKDLDFTIKVTE